jgi:hypothetical protein
MDGAGNFNRNVQFASSDTAIATVNSTGLVTTAGVTGTGPVTITITAVGDTSLTDTVVITVVA